jgi:fumarate reductase flavoprotein subunit
MDIYQCDVLVIGAGGAGLRAAIEAARRSSDLQVALVSKVYPMRSHTVAAEGGSAGVVQSHDSLQFHFDDTVKGGDWLCEQDVVEDFVARCTPEMVQLEHWGCPWSRKEDGHINVRAFGGMQIERTWFAADRTGFHILHTLFQTSLQFPSIRRFDEYFCCDLIVEDGRCQGALLIESRTGRFVFVQAKAVVMATGGAGRVFLQSTNAGTVTGDGMALAYRHGVPLRDMEFVQYHPTTMPGTGLLFTEGCRGEGGILTNKDGYRYLQDYGLGPPDPWPRKKAMELGPRDRLSQAFWHEERAGRTIPTPQGDAVHLDLRHLGAQKLHERLPLICELAKRFMGIDPVESPIPVRPSVHYTMGGILVSGRTASTLPGLYAVGECSSVGIHGANRLGSNSLAELSVFGAIAGEEASNHARTVQNSASSMLKLLAQQAKERAIRPINKQQGTERASVIRQAMNKTMERGCGIYRLGHEMQETCQELLTLRERFQNVRIGDQTNVWNTEWLQVLELGMQLDVALAIAHSALNRRESRGAHQRLDGYTERDDVNFLCHSLAHYDANALPRIDYQPVKITKSEPGVRSYGGVSTDAEKAK